MDIKDYVLDMDLADELNIDHKKIWRHDRNPKSDFPKKIKIGNRNYRLRSEVEACKLKLAENETERCKGPSARRRAAITA